MCYPDDWPCLILCPAGVVGNWEGQLRRWLPPDLGAEVCIPTTGKQLQAELQREVRAAVTVVSYDLVKSEKALGTLSRSPGVGFGVVICDESHSLKNGSTARAKAVLPLARKARRRAAAERHAAALPNC